MRVGRDRKGRYLVEVGPLYVSVAPKWRGQCASFYRIGRRFILTVGPVLIAWGRW